MAIERRTPFANNTLDYPGPYVAKVISHVDPRHSGDLRVELQTNSVSGNDSNAEGQVITARYLMPFYGVNDVTSNTQNDDYRSTQQSYGFWAVPPDPGTKVLVIFAENQINQAYWIGCIQDEFMNFMIPGNPSTTLTSNSTPDELKGKKLPVGEYNKKLNQTGSNPSTFVKPINIDSVNQLLSSGLIEDDIRGVTTSGARREVPSNVFGWSTPGPLDKREGAPRGSYGPSAQSVAYYRSRLGGSSFVMDDGDHRLIRRGSAKDTPMEYVNKEANETGGDQTLPANDLIRLRTRTGHQILMHNSEDLIYIANGRGTAWIELSSNGKIDIFSADSVSIHSQQDFNFTADRDINLTAGENVNIVGQQVRSQSIDSTSFIAGSNFSVNTAKSVSLNANAELVAYSQGNLSIVTNAEGSVLAGANLALGSTTSVGIEGCGSVRITSDGDIESKALGNTKIESIAETNLKSGLATKIAAGNVIGIKAVGNLIMKSDANIDIQGAEPPAPSGATIPAAPAIVDPTPPERALGTSRRPQHEPWFEHENFDPLKYAPENTRAGNTQPETYPPSTPDTFVRGPSGSVTAPGAQPNSYNTSGQVGAGSAGFNPVGAANIPPDPPAVEASKQEVSRAFADALFAEGFSTDEVYAAIACAETESGLALSTERGYSGTANDRIRSIFSSTRQLSDAALTELKADKAQFFEYVYGNQFQIGRNLGNTTDGDGAKFIGRGLIQLTGKANHQRYGKLAGLIDEGLISDYNPFGVTIVDDPTLQLSDLGVACKVAAAYLKERYRDFGRGTLGNFRFAIAGTEGGYELGYPKDQGYLANKRLTNGEYDPDWIRDPNETLVADSGGYDEGGIV